MWGWAVNYATYFPPAGFVIKSSCVHTRQEAKPRGQEAVRTPVFSRAPPPTHLHSLCGRSSEWSCSGELVSGYPEVMKDVLVWMQMAARLKPEDNKPARPESRRCPSVNKSRPVGRQEVLIMAQHKTGRIMGEEPPVSGSISGPGEAEGDVFVFTSENLGGWYVIHSGAAFHLVYAIWSREGLSLHRKDPVFKRTIKRKATRKSFVRHAVLENCSANHLQKYDFCENCNTESAATW